jgi:hypothetical protein
MTLSEFTSLEWLMLCHACERMGMEGDPERAQAYLDLAEACRRNYDYREAVRRE